MFLFQANKLKLETKLIIKKTSTPASRKNERKNLKREKASDGLKGI